MTIFARITRPVAPGDEPARLRARMRRRIIIERTVGGDSARRDHAPAVFERHNPEIRRTIPPARLPVDEIAARWSPLCAALGRPLPDEPFPHANAAEAFRARFPGVR